jgi:hypothetical protein
MLHLTEKIKNRTYEISLQSTGIVIGSFVNIDGFFYYEPSKNRTWGFWSEEFLKSLSNEIEKLNYPINESIEKYFDKTETL